MREESEGAFSLCSFVPSLCYSVPDYIKRIQGWNILAGNFLYDLILRYSHLCNYFGVKWYPVMYTLYISRKSHVTNFTKHENKKLIRFVDYHTVSRHV